MYVVRVIHKYFLQKIKQKNKQNKTHNNKNNKNLHIDIVSKWMMQENYKKTTRKKA